MQVETSEEERVVPVSSVAGVSGHNTAGVLSLLPSETIEILTKQKKQIFEFKSRFISH